ncbi:hypothetical protein CX029_01625 [Vibrio cholerae]|nr:hypothetical protein [Vibrio cholerae]EGR1093131.1 hypothetical protein [Vibrio cholerae]EGR3919696.1 hypothetical protein [Vibrio cholerae]EGR5120461.1 hypothetical protein [Vibrio cholerae]MCD1194491.1 hypothetical protein [Vibrio cholerae]
MSEQNSSHLQRTVIDYRAKFSRVPLLFIKTEEALVGSFSNHTNPPMLTLINTVAGLLQY